MSRSVVIRNPGADEGLVLTFTGSAVSFTLESDGSSITPASATAAATALAAGTADALTGTTVIADITENSGAIGGTNDGDLPDLTTAGAQVNTDSVREIAVKLNALLAELRTLGVLGTP